MERLKPCPKCNYHVVAEQIDMQTGMKSILCCKCHHRSKELPFYWMARLAWNIEFLKRGGNDANCNSDT